MTATVQASRGRQLLGSLPLPEFTALAYRPFRYWWFSSSSILLNQFMTQVAMAWFILQKTDSVAWVSFVVFAYGLPSFLFTLPAGVLADRWNKRYQLMCGQIAAAITALVVALLVSFDVLTPHLALVFAFIAGTSTAISQPARQALIPLLVPAEHRMNAIVLGSLSQSLSQLVGPALAGQLIYFFSISASFYVLALLLLGGIYALIRLEVNEGAAVGKGTVPRLPEFLAGFQFLWQNRPLLVIGLLYLATGIWIGGAIQALVPVLVKDEYGAGASALGFAFTATAIGAILTSLIITRLSGLSNKGGWFAAAMMLGGGSVACYGLAPSYGVALFFFFSFGCATALYTNMSQTVLQAHTPQALMGRVLSLLSLSTLGFIPLGALQAGLIATLIGPRGAAIYGGMVGLSLALLALTTAKSFRRLS